MSHTILTSDVLMSSLLQD